MKRMSLGMAFLLGTCLTVPLAACGGGEEAGPTPTAPATQVEGGPPPVSGEPTVTASGLQFIDIEVGTGDSPQPGQTVEVHYTGWPMGRSLTAPSTGASPSASCSPQAGSSKAGMRASPR